MADEIPRDREVLASECVICIGQALSDLQREGRTVLAAYQLFLEDDDLEILRDSLTSLQSALRPRQCGHLLGARRIAALHMVPDV